MLIGPFLVQYPEFAKVSTSLVQAILDDAAGRLSASVWGDYYDKGHGLLAAAMLAVAPNGINARPTPGDPTKSTYRTDFDRLCKSVTFGMRVFT